MRERLISFGALPCCCRFIDSCLMDTGLLRFCLVSLISPQRSFSAQVFFKPGKCGQYFQVILHLRVHFAKLWGENFLLCVLCLSEQLCPPCSSWGLRAELETLANIILCRLWPSIIIPSIKHSFLIKGDVVTFVFMVLFKGVMWG